MFKKLVAIAVTALLCSASAQAADFKYTFTASNFEPGYYNEPAPQSVVSGSFIISAASISSAPTAIQAIDLTINNHQYTLPEVGWDSASGYTIIGGVQEGIRTLFYGTDDFWIGIFAG